MKPPHVGQTVIYYEDGTMCKAHFGEVVRVYESGWMLDIRLRPKRGRIEGRLRMAVAYAPPQSMINGKRRPDSWDFVT